MILFTQFPSYIHVVEPPKIVTHPQELKDVVEGESAKFTIQVHGTEPFNYDWQWKSAEKGSGSQKWQPCPADWSDGATLTMPKVEKPNEGSYRCVVSNHAGEQTSNSAKLSVGKNLTLNTYILQCEMSATPTTLCLFLYLQFCFQDLSYSHKS